VPNSTGYRGLPGVLQEYVTKKVDEELKVEGLHLFVNYSYESDAVFHMAHEKMPKTEISKIVKSRDRKLIEKFEEICCRNIRGIH